MPVRTFNYSMAKAIDNQFRNEKNQCNINVNFDITKCNGIDVRHINNNCKALNCYLTKMYLKMTKHLTACPIIRAVIYRNCLLPIIFVIWIVGIFNLSEKR